MCLLLELVDSIHKYECGDRKPQSKNIKDQCHYLDNTHLLAHLPYKDPDQPEASREQREKCIDEEVADAVLLLGLVT